MSSTSKNSQYHHFVPRFLLKNFAHPFKPSTKYFKDSGRRNKRRNKDGVYPGDSMLNVIKLDGTTADIFETPMAKTLGIVDMYRDVQHDVAPNHLEEKLSKLESRAGTVIAKIRKTFEAGGKDVWITRPERDVLRKFLFIMKYRGSSAHKRFYSQEDQEYSSNDKERLLKYMRTKGFKKPIEVWLDNINVMLDVKMDPQMEWMAWLREHAYPDDAMWFIAHCQSMYMAVSSPAGPDDEFLLTENAYSIHEGPVSCYFDPITKRLVQGSYTEFHVLSVVSPKLIIVLRSIVLPEPEADEHDDLRIWRENAYERTAAQLIDPASTRSILEELPIRKARNSYSKIVDGRFTLLEGEDGVHRVNDRFHLLFSPISSKYTDRINFIMLENAHKISTVVFKSRLAAIRTLKGYLTTPCEVNGVPSFKMIEGIEDNRRSKFLRKLEKLVNDLGSKATLVYQSGNGQCDDQHQMALRVASQMLQRRLANDQGLPSDFKRRYAKLGLFQIITQAITDR